MDSTSTLSSLEESLFQETFSHQTNASLDLPLTTSQHVRHSRSADNSSPTPPAHHFDFSQVEGTPWTLLRHACLDSRSHTFRADDLHMPNMARLTDLSFAQDIYNTETPSDPLTLPFFTQASDNAPFNNTFLSQTGIDGAFTNGNPATPSTSTRVVESFPHASGGDSSRDQDTIPSPPSNTTDDSLHAVSSTTASTSDTPADLHTIERCYTPSSDATVDQSIAHIPGASRKRWRCCHPKCTEPPDQAWRSIHDARNHVRKHLGETKLYRCVKCDKFFACEKNARRHQVNQGKRYHCTVCDGMFTRIDCRNKHRKSCLGAGGNGSEERRDSDASM